MIENQKSYGGKKYSNIFYFMCLRVGISLWFKSHKYDDYYIRINY